MAKNIIMREKSARHIYDVTGMLYYSNVRTQSFNSADDAAVALIKSGKFTRDQGLDRLVAEGRTYLVKATRKCQALLEGNAS
jgi:hypothetical protein